jgi:hypothetical protein
LFGPIAASGTVVDQLGRLVSGVRIHIRAQLLVPGSLELIGRERSEVVQDGQFDIGCERCSVLRLHFLREGHHDATVEVVVEGREDDDRPALTVVGEDGSTPLVERRGLVVRLERAERTVRLVEVRGTMDSAPTGMTTSW